jgi:acetyl-CoA acetyltransferase
MWDARGKIAIVGVGASELTRRPARGLGAMAIEACRKAVADAGLPLSAIDGLTTYPRAPFAGSGVVDGEHRVTPFFILNHLPLADDVRWYAQQEDGEISSAVVEACNALLARACNYVLVWRAMYVPKGTYGKIEAPAGRAAGDAAFLFPYGFGSILDEFGMAFRRYLDCYGAKREDMATLAVSQRKFANQNEKAIFRDRPLTVEDYLDARMIADPLCLYDCDVPVQGCFAMVMTTADRAKYLPNPPAYIAGYCMNTLPKLASTVWTALPMLEHADSSMRRHMWKESGYRPADIDVAEVYDGMSFSVWLGLETAGFCGEGEAFQFIQGGRIEQGGELPLNTHGGSLSEGRMHGMGHFVEAALQISGRAGTRQVKDARTAFVQVGSPVFRNSAFLITREP